MALVIGLLALLAGCGGGDNLHRSQNRRYRHGHDSRPSGPLPDVSKIKEPIPKREPYSAYGNKSPYTVNGQTYRVLSGNDARHYVERGMASYYGNKFNGYKTSNLETYDMYQFSAAHRTLPLPSFARVTNLANGKSVVVRINDRGPFMKGRVIDLSYVAAIKIGIAQNGSGQVEVQALSAGEKPAPKQVVAVAAPVAVVAAPTWPRGKPANEPASPAPSGTSDPRHGAYLQVAAYSDELNAYKAAARLQAANLTPVQILKVTVNGRSLSRLRLGPFVDAEAAKRLVDRVEDLGFSHPKVEVN